MCLDFSENQQEYEVWFEAIVEVSLCKTITGATFLQTAWPQKGCFSHGICFLYRIYFLAFEIATLLS
jgi:hypothetical protein